MAEIAGLKLIVPSSVAGGTGTASVSASGKVTFTTADSIAVNDVFSASYDNYLVVVRLKYSTANGLLMRLRVSGSDATANDYTRQFLYANNTSVTGGRLGSQSGAIVSAGGTTEGGDHVYIYGPNLAQPTAFRNVNSGSYSTWTILDNACTHSLSTSYTGFSLVNEGGSSTITGALTVYGLSQ